MEKLKMIIDQYYALFIIAGIISAIVIVIMVIKGIVSIAKSHTVLRYKYSDINCLAHSPEYWNSSDGSLTLVMKYTIDGVEYTGTLDKTFWKSNDTVKRIVETERNIFISVDPDNHNKFCLHRDIEGSCAGFVVVGLLKIAGSFLLGLFSLQAAIVLAGGAIFFYLFSHLAS